MRGTRPGPGNCGRRRAWPRGRMAGPVLCREDEPFTSAGLGLGYVGIHEEDENGSMTQPSQLPLPAGPRRGPPGDGPPAARGLLAPLITALAAFAAVTAGTALLGVAAGFGWAAVAPRPLIVVLGPGMPYVANQETSAFIVADGWFTLLAVAGGVISGVLGYALAVRRHGAPAMAGIMAGGAAAALIARWIGQRSGAAAYHHALALGQPGARLQAPLTLGGWGALALWPLAAGLVAGGIEAAIAFRERRRRAAALP